MGNWLQIKKWRLQSGCSLLFLSGETCLHLQCCPCAIPVYRQDLFFPCRRCLSYFAPPEFRIKKEDIKNMGADELKEFPLVCCVSLHPFIILEFTISPIVVSSSSNGELSDTDSGG